MLLFLIISLFTQFANLTIGLVSGAVAAPFLKVIGEATYGFLTGGAA